MSREHVAEILSSGWTPRPMPCGLLQRQCSCGQHTGGGECAACRKKKGLLQRHPSGRAPTPPVPIAVERTLRSPGQPMDTPLRRSMESRFARSFSDVHVAPTIPHLSRSHLRVAPTDDPLEREAEQVADAALRTPAEPASGAAPEPRPHFGGVRLHMGGQAAESATAVDARAYTVGNHIVFGAGQYRPTTEPGRRLIAHELAHVLQQGRGGPSGLSMTPTPRLQRQESGFVSGGGRSGGGGAGTTWEEQPTEAARVTRIVISCRDMRLRLETAATAHVYTLEECSVPEGSYDTAVTVTGNDFYLDFGEALGPEGFTFRYRVEPGQANPATLLGAQSRVPVQVVDSLPTAPEREPERSRGTSECVIPLDDRELVSADSMNRALFETRQFEQSIWSRAIPLGQFGWVEVDATVSGRLAGNLSARYGPGRLTDICLMHLVDRQASSAPIEHLLLGRGSRTDVTSYVIGGRARFTLPAKARIRVSGEGKLRIAGDYLSVIRVAAAEGVLTALGEATLTGRIDGSVEILARASRSRARLEHPLFPLQLTLGNTSIDTVDLAAEIGIRGRAGLHFRVDLSAGFEVAGFDLWRQSWNLARFEPGISWAGGLRYSPNPGVHWDFGTLGVDDEIDLGPAEDERDEPLPFHEDAAEVDTDGIVDALLDEAQADTATPEGLSRDDPLPFDWYKPDDIFSPALDLPRAIAPTQVGREDGPTGVWFPGSLVPSRDRSHYDITGQGEGQNAHEVFGIAHWPAVEDTFSYMPYNGRRDPERTRFKRVVDALGFDRSGFDADHVWELKLRGLDYDRFDNLWPASNLHQQLAGARHHNQMRNYEHTLGNINGRWFVLSRVKPVY